MELGQAACATPCVGGTAAVQLAADVRAAAQPRPEPGPRGSPCRSRAGQAVSASRSLVSCAFWASDMLLRISSCEGKGL